MAPPIATLLEAVAVGHPDRVALTDARETLTYAGLWQAVAGWAECIAAHTEPGQLVGILAPASAQFSIALLACLAAGRPFVALDPEHPHDWITHVISDCRPALLLATDTGHGTINAPRTLNLHAARRSAAGWRPTPLSPEQPACVLYTSGSTGQPKGVVNSQRNLLQRVSQSINAAHINGEDRFLTLASPGSIVGVRDLLTALLAGARIHLIETQKAGTREILTLIRDHAITILFAFPALLRSVVQGDSSRPAESLRLVRIGGDTTLRSDIAMLRRWLRPDGAIQIVYAATEAPMMQWFVGEIPADCDERIPIGFPLPGNALAVVEDDGAPTPIGQVGELLVRSAYVALGLWSQGRCVAGAFPADMADPSMRILRTGDLVRLRPDGLFDRIGRKDRQVKIRGARVELDGVEAAIRRHDSIHDVAVIARSGDREGSTRLVAYVRPRDGSPEDLLAELAAMVRRTLPPQMRPWRFYTVPEIPRLANSKLDGQSLRALDLRKSEEESAALADTVRTPLGQDPVEIAVARVWRDRLGLALATPQDDFFDLGGDSLGAIAMTRELERTLARELPMTLINHAPTFAGFCAKLRENGPIGYEPLVLLKPGDQSPPVFLVHGVGGSVMELYPLGRALDWRGPVIGIQARGLDGRERPHESVEAMAEEYLRAIRSRQTRGPYYLCGYSFGGLVAFQLACRLESLGEEVGFLGAFAALPPGHRLLRVQAFTAYACRRLIEAMLGPRDRRFRASLGRIQRRSVRQGLEGIAPALRAVAVRSLHAARRYRPGYLNGELTIFDPECRDLRLPSSAALWSQHVRTLQHHRLPGQHQDMLSGANTEGAAALLTHCLQAALERHDRVS